MKVLLVYILVACSALSFARAEELDSLAYQFKGTHFLASYNECDHAALTNVASLESRMLEAAKKSGASVLDSCSWKFPEDGFTMVILLSESHASIHTYPEYNACFIDLFTCGEKCSFEYFDQTLREYLKPHNVAEHVLIRSRDIQDSPCSLTTEATLENSSSHSY